MHLLSAIDGTLLAPVDDFDGALVEHNGQIILILRETLSPAEQQRMRGILIADLPLPDNLRQAA